MHFLCSQCGTRFIVENFEAASPDVCPDCSGKGSTAAPVKEGAPRAAGGHKGLRPLGVALALLAAVLGTVIWIAVALMTDFQGGYVAWLIGLLIGGAAVLGRSSGKPTAVLCTALALAAVAAGKLGSADLVIQRELAELRDTELSQAKHAETRLVADALSRLPDSANKYEVLKFMIGHGFTGAVDPAAVSQQEYEEFTAAVVPKLRGFHERQPSLQQWRSERLRAADPLRAEGDGLLTRLGALASLEAERLRRMDWVFAALAVVGAWVLVMRSSPRRRPVRVEAGPIPAGQPT